MDLTLLHSLGVLTCFTLVFLVKVLGARGALDGAARTAADG